ncbi:Cytochrome P450 78A7 [Morella rubra]|uniref:Cytochrome P450 78A7 n=1 Tax=Morella rubra TaxID=262757 RepID=A0A6A1WG89_9ROSI|nr:Cytochrome P450 78A7 [Morella rubra]
MELTSSFLDWSWWLFTVPAFVEIRNLLNGLVFFSILMAIFSIALLTWAFSKGGRAWKNGRNQMGMVPIPGPRGLPILGSLFSLSHGLAHRTLARMASSHSATQLMAFSLGSTPVVITSDPKIAREILASSHFADRPIKQSAKTLMFSRAIGFAPNGAYWLLLRKIASAHLFASKRIASHEAGRQMDCTTMLSAIADEQSLHGVVSLRKHLQAAALDNIMGTVFGKRYNMTSTRDEARELQEMVREGFELLGAFNWSDYLPWLSYFYDPHRIIERCSALVPRVRKFVKKIIDEHRQVDSSKLSDNSDFVHVLLNLEGDERLEEDDMIAVLWEMIFRDSDATKLPYLQAVVKETLRVHPPGPLLSWARLSTSDVHLSNDMVVPANTTAMVNMWAITHDPEVWEDPLVFKPERFLKTEGGIDMDVRGLDLRLAPFGAGRRVCPGKNLGLVTVSLWVAKLVHHFKWIQDTVNPIDLTEVLKLSCEMKNPLSVLAIPKTGVQLTRGQGLIKI